MPAEKWGWEGSDLRQLGKYIMRDANKYGYTTKKLGWHYEVRRDNRQLLWTFRDTPVRVEQALEIPYLVYPSQGGYLGNPPAADAEPTVEYLLVGFVGSGGV
jgi:hypothetical protein